MDHSQSTESTSPESIKNGSPAADVVLAWRCLELLCEPGAAYELRGLDTAKGTVSGYYNDLKIFADHATYCSNHYVAGGTYLTLNPVDPVLLVRSHNEMSGWIKRGQTTTDEQILKRRWLLLDFDADRPSGISSTDAEHEAALGRAREVREHLTARNWAKPILADSGNGAHLLYRIDLPNDTASTELVKRTLAAVHSKFGHTGISVDRSVFNAARISKIYGTVARKGVNLVGRPHRLARVLETPETIGVISREQLEEIIAVLAPPATATITAPVTNAPSHGKFDLDGFIARHGIVVKDTQLFSGGGRKLILAHCIFNPEHGNGSDVAVFEFADGKLGYKCQHASCADKHWRDVRELLEPKQQRQEKQKKPSEKPPPSSDYELAVIDRLLAKYPADLTWSGPGYFLWDGRRFEKDELKKVPLIVEGIVRDIFVEAANADHVADEARKEAEAAKKAKAENADALQAKAAALDGIQRDLFRLARYMANYNHVSGVMQLTRGHVAVDVKRLDTTPYLFNVRNGTIDLRTGELRPHSRSDLNTKLVDLDYLPDAKCERFERFLKEIFAEDDAMCKYVQSSVGYSMTAEQREKAFWFAHGAGDTGKTTFFSALHSVFGDYFQIVPKSLFLKDNDRTLNDAAQLRGVRFGYAAETAKGRSFDEEKLKSLTGDEPEIQARLLYQEPFVYKATHHLWLASNDKPRADAADQALWNRLRILLFTVIFEEMTDENPNPAHVKNKKLLGELLQEREGILAWAVAGACEYYKNGLGEPKMVVKAGKEYRSEEDTLAQFVEQCIEHKEDVKTKQGRVYEAYKHFMSGDRRCLVLQLYLFHPAPVRR